MKLELSKPTALVAALLMFNFAWADEMPTAEPEEVGLSSERLERFSTEMEKGVEAGHFGGAVAAVARNGEIAFFESYGFRDKEAGLPMTDDTIFRLASMTKAITGVAVMILYEEGHFTLHDPVSKFIPSFKNARVQVGGVPVPGKTDTSKDKKEWSQADLDQWLKENWDTLSDEEKKKWTDYYAGKGKGDGKDKSAETESSEEVATVPADRPITIRDLLRHTAGISYGMGDIWAEGDDLGQMIDKLAAQPLKSQPGTRFEYGLSMDVLARLVEVVSGQSFDEFIQQRVFDPLEMNDAGFQVPMDQAERLVIMPIDEKSTQKDGTTSSEDPYLSPPVILMGGTGLVSTTMDYLRFCQMLLNNGELDGVRILGRKAVELMHADHMNDVADRNSGSKTGGEFHFGLTFGIDGKPGNRGELGSEGVYWWGGAYGTTFWIDPKENLVGVFMVNGVKYDEDQSIPYTQMLKHFTYQAIVD